MISVQRNETTAEFLAKMRNTLDLSRRALEHCNADSRSARESKVLALVQLAESRLLLLHIEDLLMRIRD